MNNDGICFPHFLGFCIMATDGNAHHWQSETALIAEDDDSGIGANARIVSDLIAGEYFVQVRHFNLAGGAGDYSIKVRKM